MAISSTSSSPSVAQQKQAWMAILGFALFLSLLLLVRAGRLLIPIFPLGAFAIGVFLYFRTPQLYVGFTWWMWFVGPVVRRIVDYQSGYLTPGPWTLTPTLVTLISFASLVRHLPKSYKQGGLPFLLCIGAVFYGFLIGLIQNKTVPTILTFFSWLNPLLLSFHLYVNWREYPNYRQTIQRTFLWGVLVMGIYGMYQYLVAPEWDRFWLINISAGSFGKPEPLGIRVSSTMDAPQTFASAMMAGLIILFSIPGNLRFPAMGVGFLSFLLSSARSAWLSWLGGMMFFVPFLKARLQMNLIISITVAALIILPLATLKPFSTMIAPRIESLTNTQSDTSYQDRSQGYSELLGVALSEFQGKGLGVEIKNSSIGVKDSGILSMFFSLGWLGAIPYLGGVILILFNLFQGSEINGDAFASASRAIALGTFLQIILNVVTEGAIGMFFWGFLGIGMAARNYYLYQKMLEQDNKISN